MKVIETEELKKIELDILLDVAQFCEENSIRYYLCGGTLLGVIRHKGFIPWDDDIDIIMPRPDYMKFLQVYNCRKSHYKVNSIFNNNRYNTSFAEVEDTRTIKIYNGFDQKQIFGVNIDVFPMDGSPEETISRRIFWGINNILARIAVLSYQKFKVSNHFADKESRFTNFKKYLRTAVKFIAIPLARCSRFLNLNLIVNQLAMRYDVDNCEFIGVSVFPHYGYKECVHGKGFLKIKKRCFEGHLLNTPENYDEYLTNLYGDYMKLPKKDKQVSHHDFDAYWKGN